MITLKSHGFKFSRPEANLVFDVSYFKNPWRDAEIKEQSDPVLRKVMVLDFMKEQRGVKEMVDSISELIWTYYWMFSKENIQIAICCSAGEYRSPAMVELVAERLRKDKQMDFIIKHSENSKI